MQNVKLEIRKAKIFFLCVLCGSLSFSEQVFLRDEVTVAFSPRGESLEVVLKELKRAEKSVDVAMFYFTHQGLMDVLCYLSAKRDVRVRVLVDEDMGKPSNRPLMDRLSACGIDVRIIKPSKFGKLHMKATVIDGVKVMTGAANWTKNAFDQNYEDVVVIESPGLAARYLQWFDVLAADGEVVQGSLNSDATERVPPRFPDIKTLNAKPEEGLSAPDAETFDSIRGVESYFTPGRVGLDRLLGLIGNATSSVDIGMYCLSDPSVIDVLTIVAKSGRAKVRMFMDDEMVNGSYLLASQKLWEGGVELWLLSEPNRSLHLKSTVVDGRYVATGSANFTVGAVEVNAEDLLIFDSREMAAHYTKFLEHIAEHCRSYGESAMPVSVATPLRWRVEDGARQGTAAATVARVNPALPETGPRTNWREAMTRAPSTNFTVKAAVDYIDDGEYLPVLLDLIKSAQRSILINMYEIPKRKTDQVHLEKILHELTRAVKREVYVRMTLYMPKNESDALSESHSELAERLRAEGIDVRFSVPGVPLHEKMILVDGRKALIGTHNWSEGALTGERVYECGALMILPQPDERLAQHMLSRHVISDMRSRETWQQEIATFRHLQAMKKDEREEVLQRLEVQRPLGPKSQVQSPTTLDLGPETLDMSFKTLDDIEILPTDTIASAVVQAAQSATQSVCILTYYLSDNNYGPIRTFYEILKKKAQNGLDVTIICSFGPTTTAGVKKDTMNFASTLEPSGIKVLYIDSMKVQHKKMVAVDSREVILGSSNLTESGMSTSDEINVRINSPTFVHDALADFEELKALAKTMQELTF